MIPRKFDWNPDQPSAPVEAVMAEDFNKNPWPDERPLRLIINKSRSMITHDDDDTLMMLPTALRHRLIEQPMESGEHRLAILRELRRLIDDNIYKRYSQDVADAYLTKVITGDILIGS
jgi:hypothetical protein